MLLATQDIDEPVEADFASALREVQALTNPEDFIILTGESFELRAAGPDRGKFLVQLENRDRKVARERSDVLPQELESFIRCLFEGDTSWAEDFVKNSQPIPKWILVVVIIFFLAAMYVAVT